VSLTLLVLVGDACAGVLEAVMTALRDRVSALASEVGNGLADGVTIGPLINRGAVARVAALVEDALSKGAVLEVGGVLASGAERRPDADKVPRQAASSRAPRVVVNGVGDADDAGGLPGGEPLPASGRHDGEGCFFPPTLLSGMTTDMAMFAAEIFGPVLAVYDFVEEGEALSSLAGGQAGGLAAYVFTRSGKRAERASRMLDVGMIAINNVDLSDARTPFGGVGLSGHAREGGPGLGDYTFSKYILGSSGS
jgi:succinate-semialdehyde dehydrogenase / glutarate-semialdehyde dehydrogenase